jgi:membrane-associated protease RseP (regulator of RpoE activity)
MRFDLSKYSTRCVGIAAMVAFGGSLVPGSLRAEEEDVIVEVVAGADEAAPLEVKRGVVREIRQRIESGAGGTEEVEVIENAVGPGNALFWTQRIGGEEMGKYWIGVECREASPELRAQLGLEDGRGLVVVRISDGSAAAKAGLKKHDVVVRAGELKLGNIPDLAKAVNAAEGKEVKLKIIRAGKEESIVVTPSERPGDVVKFIARPHAGVFWSSDAPRLELPENMSIKIERQGKKAASIFVRRGDEKWEATEEHLDKLPDDVRPLVQRAIGGGPWTMPLPAAPRVPFGIATPPTMQIEALPPSEPGGERRMKVRAWAAGEKVEGQPHGQIKVDVVPPAGATVPHVVPLPPGFKPGDMTADIMKRLEMLDRRLEKMQDEVRRLRDERQNKATFERRVVPRRAQGGPAEGEHRAIEVEIDDRPEPRPNR